MAVLVSANADISWAKPFAHDNIFQVMTNGHFLVLYENTSTGNLNYRTSPDAGVTWTAAIELPGAPTPANLNAILVVNESLYLWYSGATIQLYVAPYDDATNQFITHAVFTYTIPGATVELVDATYDSGTWHVVASVVRGSTKSVAVFSTPGFDATLGTFWRFIDLNYPHSGLGALRVLLNAGFLYAAWYDTTRLQLYLAPVVVEPFGYTWTPASLELAATSTDSAALFDVVQDPGGTQTLILAQNNLLSCVTRTAADSYSPPISLQAQIASGQSPATFQDGADLYVGYETQVNEPNGEAYLLKRTSSRWHLPIIQAGGSSAGFRAPAIGSNASFYQDTSNNLYFLSWAPSGAPLAPTGLSPVGYVNTLTPTLSWVSNPGAPTDPTKSHQVRTVRVSDSHLMDDSGEVTGAATTYPVPGGASLAYNIAYEFQVREKDSLSALGAGTWGPYSSFAVFTPVRAAVPIITKVTSAAIDYTVFPATITGADIRATVGYTQPDSDSTNSYRMILYDTDDLTLLGKTAFQALSPVIASGGSFITIDWTSHLLVDGHVYHFAVQTADSVTGVVSESAHVQLTVAFAAPPPATGLSAFVDNDEGTVALSCTLPGEAVATIWEWQPYTETGVPLGWMPLGPSGQLWNRLISPLQAPQNIADYRVTVVNALGIKSTPDTIGGVLLDNALDYAGIWVNDINDPLSRKCYFGYVENWDSLKRDIAWDMQEWTPQGSQLPIQSFGLKDYWIIGASGSFKVFLPSQELDSSGSIRYGADNRDMAISLAKSHNPLIYRDRRFPVPIPVVFVQWEDQPNDDVNTDLTLELHHTGFYAPLPVVGSLV